MQVRKILCIRYFALERKSADVIHQNLKTAIHDLGIFLREVETGVRFRMRRRFGRMQGWGPF